MKITLEIEDSKEGKALLTFLKQLPFVRLGKPYKKEKSRSDIDSIFGIWKDREVTEESIRTRAWRN